MLSSCAAAAASQSCFEQEVTSAGQSNGSALNRKKESLMRIVSLLLTVVMATSTALAQQSVPPPPQPAADKPAGPSLEVTMKFIQDKLNEIGTVNFAGYVHDSSNNTDGVQKFSATISNIATNPGSCTLSYHRLVLNSGRKEHDENVVINLREVKNISVLPDEQDWQMYLVRTGDSTKTVKDVPDISALVIKLNNGKDPTIRFYEQELADRVAKALVHAVELCGGGPKPEPF
jgi:hypothetical protein